MAALKSLPITSFINEMNTIMDDFYKNSPPHYRDPSYSIGALTTNVYVLSLASSVQRVNLFRLHVMMLRNIKSESAKPGSSHYLEMENLDLSCSWTVLVQVSHRMATIASECLLKFKDQLPYSQNMLFLIFQGVLGLLPVLFHDDERVRKMAEDDLQKVIPVMEQISDCISWHLTSVYHFILKEIYPDPVKLRRYVKMAINGKNLEALAKDSANYPLLNRIVALNLPCFGASLMNISEDMWNVNRGYCSFDKLFDPSSSKLPNMTHLAEEPTRATAYGSGFNFKHTNG
ncbi:unnamed protein product [Ambrosiozyma monospora]|uniref:Unnamed protein product n=1 Tax=Ambrosiozyma monospora TaxID=43982 RepID=A0ACB5TYJ2_AMBMO|nr:unnamed protein product [Ambrosiozyma monospora]